MSTPTLANATAMPSSKAPKTDVYLPVYAPMDAVPLARFSGRLIEADGCLWIDGDGGRALAIWPSGSTIERDGDSLIVVNSADARAVVGTEVVAGGGEYRADEYELVVELIGEEVPGACRGDDVYWLVYDVRAADG